jgi:hypothetical protein
LLSQFHPQTEKAKKIPFKPVNPVSLIDPACPKGAEGFFIPATSAAMKKDYFPAHSVSRTTLSNVEGEWAVNDCSRFLQIVEYKIGLSSNLNPGWSARVKQGPRSLEVFLSSNAD